MSKLLTVTNGPTWPGNTALPAGGTKVGTVTFRPTARLASGTGTTIGLSIADVYVDNTGVLVLRGQKDANTVFKLWGGLRTPGSVQPPSYQVEERLVIGGKAIEQRFTLAPFEDLPAGSGTWDYRTSPPDVKFVSAPPSFASDIAAVQQTVAQAQQQAQQAAASAAGSAAIVAAAGNAGRQTALATLGMVNFLKGYNTGTRNLALDGKTFSTPILFKLAEQTPISRIAVPYALGLILQPPGNDPTSSFHHTFTDHPPVVAGQTIRLGFWVHRGHQVATQSSIGVHLHLKNAQDAMQANMLMPHIAHTELGTLGLTKTANGVTVTIAAVHPVWSFFQITFVAPVAAVRVTLNLIVAGIILAAVPSDNHAFFLNPTYLGHAEAPVDPYTVYPETPDAAGVSAPRRSGGVPGLVVDTGTTWVKATTAMTTQLLLSGVLDARGRIATAGEYASVEGWGMVPNTAYYLTDTTPINLSPMPATGIPTGHVGTKMSVLITTAAALNGAAIEARVLPPMPEAAPPGAAFPGVYYSPADYVANDETDLAITPGTGIARSYIRGSTPAFKLTSTEDRPLGEASPVVATVGGVSKRVYLRMNAGLSNASLHIYKFTRVAMHADGEYLAVIQTLENNPDNVGLGITFRETGSTAYMLRVINGWHQFQSYTLPSDGSPDSLVNLPVTGANNPGFVTDKNLMCLRLRIQGTSGKAKLWAYDNTKTLAEQAQSEPAAWTLETSALTNQTIGHCGASITGFSAGLYLFCYAPIGTPAVFAL